MAASLGISGSAFDKWNVQPIGKAGRESFFTVQDVLQNRLDNKTARLAAKNASLDDPDGEGLINPALEKALFDREKRIGQELSNDKQKGNLFPLSAAGFVFARVGTEMAAVLESLPSKIKRVMPKMTATHLNEVKKEIAKARNSCADIPDRLDEFLDEYYAPSEK